MRNFSKLITFIIILAMAATLGQSTVWGETYEFESDGTSKNPFTPQGYYVKTENGSHWLHSTYNNSGKEVKYTGVSNGVDYLEAKKSDGSNYTLCHDRSESYTWEAVFGSL